METRELPRFSSAVRNLCVVVSMMSLRFKRLARVTQQTGVNTRSSVLDKLQAHVAAAGDVLGYLHIFHQKITAKYCTCFVGLFGRAVHNAVYNINATTSEPSEYQNKMPALCSLFLHTTHNTQHAFRLHVVYTSHV